MPIHDRIEYPVQEIAERIAAGETQQSIADDLAQRIDPRITCKLIGKVCKKHGIKCQRTGPREGPGHPEWRGGQIIDKNGYRHVWAPDHPECQRLNAARAAKANGKYYRKEKYIQEHRLVMEKHIGRYLLPSEVVHHRNNDKLDNRIENLELFDSNARHLAETLKGQCPKWTNEGRANILAARILHAYPDLAQRYDYRQVGSLLLGIQKELGLSEPPNKEGFARYLAERGITAQQACETALQREQLQLAS